MKNTRSLALRATPLRSSSSRSFAFKGGGLLLLLISICTTVRAEWGVSVASGYGTTQLVPIRFGLQKTLQTRWRTESTWPISAYWEGSFYSMHRKNKVVISNNPQSLKVAALAGVLRFERAHSWRSFYPYGELGLGLSYFNHKQIGGRNLGIHFQFEDRLGFGLRWGEARQYDFGYKVIHFSNAYLGASNHGINVHLLSFNYWF